MSAVDLDCFWLPPFEIIDLSPDFDTSDILDLTLRSKLIAWIDVGIIAIAHFGTPCNTFSMARSGRSTLRSLRFLFGVPGLLPAHRDLLRLSDQLVDITCDLAYLLWRRGGHFTIENPASSLLWKMPRLCDLLQRCGAFPILIHMCAYGADYLKPTIFACSHSFFVDLGCTCPGADIHPFHRRLRGREYDNGSGKWVWKTAKAARYPLALARRYASIAHRIVHPTPIPSQTNLAPISSDGIQNLDKIFAIKHSESRKRPLGTPIVKKISRQRLVGSLAVDSGYQLKRSVADHIINVEAEPGETIRMALDTIHPFLRNPDLQPSIDDICSKLLNDRAAVRQRRIDRITFWAKRAQDLRSVSIAEINSIDDCYIRNLLKLNNDKPDAELGVGDFVHLSLWREMARSANVGDTSYIDEFTQGFDIVGEVARSHVWAPQHDQALITVQELDDRAWDIRRIIDRRVLRRAGGEHAQATMDDSMKDVKAGFAIGPYRSHDEVTAIVGTDRWIGTERFSIEQKGKIRNIDSATASMVNPATAITEHLDIASTDGNVALLRRLFHDFPDVPISGWVLDEKSAYRWIPIKPSQRRYAVISTYDPASKSIVYFVMIGHPFGMRSAVYNYNRRSLLLNSILRREFDVLSAFYYDDKFAFEPSDMINSSYLCAISMHMFLGAVFNFDKLTMGDSPQILGVLYDLRNRILSITDDRRAGILTTIEDIFNSGRLGSGLAAKFKGRLSFAAMQFWGKIGRAYLRCLSERQYTKSGNNDISPSIALCLREWTRITIAGRPKPILPISDQPADIVVFTDGFFPNSDLGESGISRVGGVIFDRSRLKPMVFTLPITTDMMRHWIPRKTQISMIEMFAPILAVEFLGDASLHKSILFFVDNESSEGALVKGYSAMEDICELTAIFWKLVMERSILAYVDRVSTDANIADGPSRDDPRFWKLVDELGWQILDTWTPDYLDPSRSFKGLGGTSITRSS